MFVLKFLKGPWVVTIFVLKLCFVWFMKKAKTRKKKSKIYIHLISINQNQTFTKCPWCAHNFLFFVFVCYWNSSIPKALKVMLSFFLCRFYVGRVDLLIQWLEYGHPEWRVGIRLDGVKNQDMRERKVF